MEFVREHFLALPWHILYRGLNSYQENYSACRLIQADLPRMASIGTTEAAKRLKLSPRRIAAMISQEIIHATKVGNTWIIDEGEIQRLSRIKRLPGRPKKKK